MAGVATRPAAAPGADLNHARWADTPDMAAVALRLAKLSAADMPWLRHDVDLTPDDGGQEVLGLPR